MKKNKKNIRDIIHKNNCKNLVIITGQQRSGKSMITNLISSFSGPTNVKIDFFLDNLIQLVKNNFLSIEQFKNIFLIFIDNLIINSTLGRNLNFKKGEESSVWNTSNPKFFLNRLKKNILKKKLKVLLKKENELFIVLHNFIQFKKILHNCKIKTKIIYVKQDPVDQIYSMYKSKITKMGDNLDRSLIFKYKNKKIGNDIYNLEVEYSKMSTIGKILLIKYISDIFDIKAINERDKNIKILKIDYQNILNKPSYQTSRLLKFLNKKKTKKTNKFFSMNSQIQRKIFIKKKNRLKREKFLLSIIKSKQDLKLFKKIIKIQ